MGDQFVRKSQWKNAIWITRLAVILGVFSLCLGFKVPRLFQTKVFAVAALVAIGLSAVGIVTALWGLQRRSSRLRDLRFWVLLVLNLVVIVFVLRMYVRATAKPVDQEPDNLLQAPQGSA